MLVVFLALGFFLKLDWALLGPIQRPHYIYLQVTSFGMDMDDTKYLKDECGEMIVCVDIDLYKHAINLHRMGF